MDNFTPISGLLGGAFIGLGAAVYLVVLGRVAGISGIVGGLFDKQRRDVGLRIAFIVGLLMGPLLVMVLSLSLPVITIDASWPVIILGGLLVGYGTQMGSGCTSGHGVCGLARLSPRSIVATALFMGAGFAIVFLLRQGLGG